MKEDGSRAEELQRTARPGAQHQFINSYAGQLHCTATTPELIALDILYNRLYS
jgi:hypothetical protein